MRKTCTWFVCAGGGYAEGSELRPQHRAVLWRLHSTGLRAAADYRVHGRWVRTPSECVAW